MGLCVGAFALLGLGLVYTIFGLGLGQVAIENIKITENWIGI